MTRRRLPLCARLARQQRGNTQHNKCVGFVESPVARHWRGAPRRLARTSPRLDNLLRVLRAPPIHDLATVTFCARASEGTSRLTWSSCRHVCRGPSRTMGSSRTQGLPPLVRRAMARSAGSVSQISMRVVVGVASTRSQAERCSERRFETCSRRYPSTQLQRAHIRTDRSCVLPRQSHALSWRGVLS